MTRRHAAVTGSGEWVPRKRNGVAPARGATPFGVCVLAGSALLRVATRRGARLRRLAELALLRRERRLLPGRRTELARLGLLRRRGRELAGRRELAAGLLVAVRVRRGHLDHALVEQVGAGRG